MCVEFEFKSLLKNIALKSASSSIKLHSKNDYRTEIIFSNTVKSFVRYPNNKNAHLYQLFGNFTNFELISQVFFEPYKSQTVEH